MSVDAAGLVDEIDAALRAEGSPERAPREKAYLKSSLTQYGTSVPAIRAVVKSAVARHRDLSHDELVRMTGGLWAVRVHERRMAAVELLVLFHDRLGVDDVSFLESLLRDSHTWALVDPLAASVLGPLVDRYPALARTLDKWAGDADFWIRRSALLALLGSLRRGAGDFDRFGRYADTMLEEKEFFIRKAIGWVLRDTARRRPDLVYEWLLPRATRASGVTIREAVKPLSPPQRAAVLKARGQDAPGG